MSDVCLDPDVHGDQADDSEARELMALRREKAALLAELARKSRDLRAWEIDAKRYQAMAHELAAKMDRAVERYTEVESLLWRAKIEEREACCEDVRAALTTGLLTPGQVELAIAAIRSRGGA